MYREIAMRPFYYDQKRDVWDWVTKKYTLELRRLNPNVWQVVYVGQTEAYPVGPHHFTPEEARTYALEWISDRT